MELLKTRLLTPVPPRILICSTSSTTRALVSNLLQGFKLISCASVDEAMGIMQSVTTQVDFVVLDHPAEAGAEDLARWIKTSPSSAAKLIHLWTPTSKVQPNPLARWENPPPAVKQELPTGNIVRVNKPPRKARLLNVLAALKDGVPTSTVATSTSVSSGIDRSGALEVAGNVLIAEDNPVAQKLLCKQLERYKLSVTATSNGEEAVAAWESHEPGYFRVALFDHRALVLTQC